MANNIEVPDDVDIEDATEDTPEVVTEDAIAKYGPLKYVTGKAKSTVAYGKDVDEFEYSWKVRKFASWDQAVAFGAGFEPKQLLAIRTAKDLANARSKAYQARLDELKYVKPTAENDISVALRDTYRTVAVQKKPDGTPKFTEQEACKRAAMALGLDEWPADVKVPTL